jgi:hypothetical protein
MIELVSGNSRLYPSGAFLALSLLAKQFIIS